MPNYETMTIDEIEARAAEIEGLMAAEDADLDALTEEVRALQDRKTALIEERKAASEAVAAGAGEDIESKEDIKMSNKEIRNSQEYIEAYARYIRSGSDKECRSLLTENVSGTIPVPEFVYGIVAERVKASAILSRTRKMNAAGNVKVGFEISAPEAAAHTEGGTAIAEEDLTLGIVTMVPETLKKWVSFSDEVVDNANGFLEYIYDEVARGIVKAREKAVIDAILNAPQVATATAPAVAKTGSAAGAITDIVDARALLSSAAEDIVVIVSPAQYAQYRGLQMAANYGVDPFDGREVIISDYATAPIVGDLSGVLENLPKGEDVEFKYDDHTEMTKDIVRLLGRLPVATAVVGQKFFTKVSA